MKVLNVRINIARKYNDEKVYDFHGQELDKTLVEAAIAGGRLIEHREEERVIIVTAEKYYRGMPLGPVKPVATKTVAIHEYLTVAEWADAAELIDKLTGGMGLQFGGGNIFSR